MQPGAQSKRILTRKFADGKLITRYEALNVLVKATGLTWNQRFFPVHLKDSVFVCSREEVEVDVELSLDGDDKIVGMGELTGTAVLKCPVRKIEKGHEAEEAAGCALPTRRSSLSRVFSFLFSDHSCIPIS